MNKNTLNNLKILFLLFTLSYILNFIWESIHAANLYILNISNFEYVKLMFYVSFVDATLILTMYVVVGLFWKNLNWIRRSEPLAMSLFILLGLIFAIIIEYDAIYLRHKWSYSLLMPTIFGLGISPLVQLSVTGLLGVVVCKRMLCKIEKG